MKRRSLFISLLIASQGLFMCTKNNPISTEQDQKKNNMHQSVQPTDDNNYKNDTRSVASITTPVINWQIPANNQQYTIPQMPSQGTFQAKVSDMNGAGKKVWFYLDGVQFEYWDVTDIGLNTTSAIFTDEAITTTYGAHKFKVKAENVIYGITFSTSNEITFYLNPPPPPAAPTISQTWDNSHPKIYWSAVSGANNYLVYRKFYFYATGQTTPYSQIANITSTQYTDGTCTSYTPPSNKATAYYVVKAQNQYGASSYSNEVYFFVKEPVI
jgi:hypothetical protein